MSQEKEEVNTILKVNNNTSKIIDYISWIILLMYEMIFYHNFPRKENRYVNLSNFAEMTL